MKKSFLIYAIIGLLLSVSYSCKKDTDTSNDETPNITPNPVNGIFLGTYNPNVTYGTLTDQEGNTYKTVTIGSQTWMAQNLRTTIYNDMSSIEKIADPHSINGYNTGAYSNGDHGYNIYSGSDSITTFGRFYNFYAVSTQKLAPTGWHVATSGDFDTLFEFLGGTYADNGAYVGLEVSNKLRETGILNWWLQSSVDDTYLNQNATNETGFTALPTDDLGGSQNLSAIFWSSTALSSDLAYPYYIGYNNFTKAMVENKFNVFPVRCVKD